MRHLGSPSWRLRVNDSADIIDAALLVRECLDLPVPPSPCTPPRRGGRVPHREAVLPDSAREDAGRQWLSWWRRLVDVTLLPDTPAPLGEDPRTRAHRRIAARQRVFDPPLFEALSAGPALRTAVLAVIDDAGEWQRTAGVAGRRGRGESRLDWALTRDVAAALAAEHGVSPDRLDASLLLIDVPGRWYHVTRPGAAVCSVTTATDPSTANSLLRAVFTSGLHA